VKNLEQDAWGIEKNFAVFSEKLDKLGVKSYQNLGHELLNCKIVGAS